MLNSLPVTRQSTSKDANLYERLHKAIDSLVVKNLPRCGLSCFDLVDWMWRCLTIQQQATAATVGTI